MSPFTEMTSTVESQNDYTLPNMLQLAREGDFKTMERLLASIRPSKVQKILNQLDSNKISILHYAARYDHLDIVKLLVEKGADINIRGDDGLTPLHFCARYSPNILCSIYWSDQFLCTQYRCTVQVFIQER